MVLAGGLAFAAVVALVIIGAVSRSGGGSSTIPAEINRDGRTLGSPTAPVTVVAWEDFQCPFCRQANDTALAQVIENYVKAGQVKVEYRHFAFLGNESIVAAEASECANDQGKFWEYHDILFANQQGENRGAFSTNRLKQMADRVGLDRAMFDSCLESGKYRSAIEAETRAGRQLGIDSTPVFFVNGTKISGAQPYSVFKTAIDKALAGQ
ncbi:MAG TPA: DsbA family protein [Dehalococcoidia bacterium]|nr:DsbA family protein [Dehalococcoidia bacterium]